MIHEPGDSFALGLIAAEFHQLLVVNDSILKLVIHEIVIGIELIQQVYTLAL